MAKSLKNLEADIKRRSVGSSDIKAISDYLRFHAAGVVRRMLHQEEQELKALAGELRIIQKLLEVVDPGDPALVKTPVL